MTTELLDIIFTLVKDSKRNMTDDKLLHANDIVTLSYITIWEYTICIFIFFNIWERPISNVKNIF